MLGERRSWLGKTSAFRGKADQSNAGFDLNETETAARTLGLQLVVVRAGNEREIDAAFATLVQQRAMALLVFSDQYLYSRRG